MTPGDIAFTRISRPPYSTASDLVTATSPPLVSAVNADGTADCPCSASVVVTLMMWPHRPARASG